MTAKGRVRSRKSKSAPAATAKQAKQKKKRAAKPKPKISAEEKRRLVAELRTGLARVRRQDARADMMAAKPELPPPPAVCNEEELRFVTEYMRDLNGSAAIIRAGIHADPKVAKVYASRYLDRPHVIMELSRRRADLLAKNELSLERVLEELRRVGLSQVSDVVAWDDRGFLTINPKAELTEQQLSAIESIEEIPGMFGSRLKVKMHSKIAALKDLRKHLAPSPAEARFGATGSGGSATIVIEGGPTGLEINVNLGGETKP